MLGQTCKLAKGMIIIYSATLFCYHSIKIKKKQPSFYTLVYVYVYVLDLKDELKSIK